MGSTGPASVLSLPSFFLSLFAAEDESFFCASLAAFSLADAARERRRGGEREDTKDKIETE